MKIDVSTLVNPFVEVNYYEGVEGYIVWRRGTGGNVELLHIRSSRLREGYGTRLIKEMVRRLRSDPPYKTIFGFTRTANRDAHQFYASLGFDLSPVRGVYADGDAVVFSRDYDALVKDLIDDDGPRWDK